MKRPELANRESDSPFRKVIPITLALVVVLVVLIPIVQGRTDDGLSTLTMILMTGAAIAVVVITHTAAHYLGKLSSRFNAWVEDAKRPRMPASAGSSRLEKNGNTGTLQDRPRRARSGMVGFLLDVADNPMWESELTKWFLAAVPPLLLNLWWEGKIDLMSPSLYIGFGLVIGFSLVAQYVVATLRRFEQSREEVDPASITADPENSMLEKRVGQLKPAQKERRKRQ